ncbi:MAG TPA: TolC family protein [Leptospiraceae bacterium]|nr:TolC family protein [Leptospiraceae bacterium]HMW05662.1 TolC family protein [Leptospiraceae bacterium]HMX34831.1 TolC family protein [Leptospiraceae bacterium]HMY30305.1 TolC family protein [Leptospiraceae bacterium]HMZ63658.1 TolC family protein [Leptospiraceae bacterium]
MKYKSLLLITLLIVATNLNAEDTLSEESIKLAQENAKPVTGEEKPKKVLRLTLKEAVQRSVEFNPTIRNSKYELVKYDSGFLKSESKYSWRLVGGADIVQGVLPYNQANILSGTRTQTNRYNMGIEKVFTTGTYFKIDASTQRFDNNAFEDPLTSPSGFRGLAIPPLYTGAITATLAQDILKNTFGMQDRNNQKILKNQSEITKEELSLRLSNTIVAALVDYWNYSVSDSSVATFEQLLKNTKNIRDLTKQKTGLGLAENFEINQWNALYTQTENQLERAKLERDENKRKLIRNLNLTSDSEIGSISDMETNLPANLDYEKDLEYAYQNRGDWKSMKLRREIAELSMKNAKDNALPSLKVSGSYAYQAQTTVSPQENFVNGTNGIPSFRYHNLNANAKLTYPIGDTGVKAELRDAAILQKQVAISEEDLKKEIADEIRARVDAVLIGHKILQNAIKTRKESESYYNGLLGSFRQGRFTAVAVKNALDTLVQNELQETQAKINFNINILRYELAKNSLLKKFDIDVDKIVPDSF